MTTARWFPRVTASTDTPSHVAFGGGHDDQKLFSGVHASKDSSFNCGFGDRHPPPGGGPRRDLMGVTPPFSPPPPRLRGGCRCASSAAYSRLFASMSVYPPRT